METTSGSQRKEGGGREEGKEREGEGRGKGEGRKKGWRGKKGRGRNYDVSEFSLILGEKLIAQFRGNYWSKHKVNSHPYIIIVPVISQVFVITLRYTV